jgi:hypothetical protein
MRVVRIVSNCNKHQYASIFTESHFDNLLGVVGLNPSILKEGNKNPTISILMQIAKREGYEGIFVTNLYSYITPDPKKLNEVKNPIGSKNERWIKQMYKICDKVLCIWGNNSSAEIKNKVLGHIKEKAYTIGLTKSGNPRHVLHTKKDAKLMPL